MNRSTYRFIIIFLNLFLMQCYHSKKDNIDLLTLLSQKSAPVRITIIGDSLSQWSDSFGLKQKVPTTYSITDVSIAGYDTKLWLEDLARAESIPTDIWIIELGTNDASYYGTTDFKDRYTQLLRRLEQRSFSYFLLSTVPKTNQTGLHSAIATNNDVIRDLVKNNSRYRLADLEAVFTKSSENVSLYSITDPIHPNQIGYELIGEEYRKILLGL